MEYKNCLKGIVVAAALVSGVAHAGTVTNPSLGGTVVISDGSTIDTTWNFNGSYVNNGDGTFTYVGSNSPTSTLWNFSWDITVNPDPLINSTLTIVNKTAGTKNFDILFTLPVGTGFAPAYKSGSMGITFTDFNGNGSPADGNVALNNIIWTGRIDGIDAMSLYAFDGGCGPGSPGCSVNLGTVSDGPLLHAAGVSSNIGLHLSFDLTAGDKVTFTNLFEVTPVPLPGAVWLFGSGLLGLGAFVRRRRRSS